MSEREGIIVVVRDREVDKEEEKLLQIDMKQGWSNTHKCMQEAS